MRDTRVLAITPEVAEYLRVAPRTLDAWAYRGTGPKFARIAGQRRYCWADVEAWVAEQVKAAA